MRTTISAVRVMATPKMLNHFWLHASWSNINVFQPKGGTVFTPVNTVKVVIV